MKKKKSTRIITSEHALGLPHDRHATTNNMERTDGRARSLLNRRLVINISMYSVLVAL